MEIFFLSFFHVYFEYVDKTKTTNFANYNNKAIQEWIIKTIIIIVIVKIKSKKKQEIKININVNISEKEKKEKK